MFFLCENIIIFEKQTQWAKKKFVFWKFTKMQKKW